MPARTTPHDDALPGVTLGWLAARNGAYVVPRAAIGKNEFVVILEGVCGQPDAGTAAEKILAACGESYRLRGRLVHFTVSVGIGLYPRDGRDAESLLDHADRAMYRAKAQGRNSYCFVALPYGLMLNDE